MNKTVFKRIDMCISIFFMGLMSLILCGSDGVCASESRGGYQIDSYNVMYRVTEDNVYHVSETIAVTFNEYRHGIYRKIPEVNNISRADGSTSTVVASVDVKSCSDLYSDYREGDNRVIKIGDKNHEIIGPHTYTIDYEVDWGNDRVEGADEFYMNLIGDGWDVPISNLSFTIDMPKDFDDTGDNVGMYYGGYGSIKTEGIRYGKNKGTITGVLSGVDIQPGEYFSVRIVLPDGYFVKNNSFKPGLISLVLCCVFLSISLLIWFAKGRDKDVIDTVEFYPPDGLNCAEMAYSYYGSLESTDVVPMLVGLAAKGYIEIIQSDNKGKDFSLKVLRDYEGTDEAEQAFLLGLKAYGAIATKKELQNSFYKTIGAVKKLITDKMKGKIFFKSTLIWRLITFPLALIPYVVGLAKPIKFYTGDPSLIMIFSFGFFLGITLFGMIIASKKTKTASRVICIIMGIAALVVGVMLIKDSINYVGVFYWIVLAGCIINNIMQVIFYSIIDKRTDYGIDLLGRINGFRNYLETAERPHLVALVNQDPQYFYKILPYTYVLNITDVWVKQFEGIEMEPPRWYRGSSHFNYYHFNSFMNNTMASARAAMTSTPGGSSGGGFSGGGGGGGGGGSW